MGAASYIGIFNIGINKSKVIISTENSETTTVIMMHTDGDAGGSSDVGENV